MSQKKIGTHTKKMFEGLKKGLQEIIAGDTDTETVLICDYCHKTTEYMGTISRKSDGKVMIDLCSDCLDRLEKIITVALVKEEK